MQSIPVLRVLKIERSLSFYQSLGFSQQWMYKPQPNLEDPAYCCIEREGCILHLSSHSGDGAFGSAVYVACEDVDAVYRSAARALGESVALPPTDQTWGNREMYLTDPDKHSIRFCGPIPG
jgi:uncharacterized glyoxalase superfamily protein PhnB